MNSVLVALLALCASALKLSDQTTVCVRVTVAEFDASGKSRVVTRPTFFMKSGKPGFADMGREMPGEHSRVLWIGIMPTLLADGRVNVNACVAAEKSEGFDILMQSTVTLELNQQGTIRSGNMELALTPSLKPQ